MFFFLILENNLMIILQVMIMVLNTKMELLKDYVLVLSLINMIKLILIINTILDTMFLYHNIQIILSHNFIVSKLLLKLVMLLLITKISLLVLLLYKLL